MLSSAICYYAWIPLIDTYLDTTWTPIWTPKFHGQHLIFRTNAYTTKPEPVNFLLGSKPIYGNLYFNRNGGLTKGTSHHLHRRRYRKKHAQNDSKTGNFQKQMDCRTHSCEKASTTWPENVAKLAGAWKDLPSAEKIRRGMGKHARRESV